MKTMRLYFIWTYLVLCCVSSARADNVTENATSPFTFPYVKPDPYPLIIQIPEGAINNFTKTGSSTGGSFALAYVTVPPGAGPGPHIHHWTNEWFYYPEGGIVMFSSDQQYPDPNNIPNGIQLPKANMHRYLTKPGDLIYGPAFYVHGFRNEGNVSRTVILVWTPDKITPYFLDAGQVVTDPCKMPPIGNLNLELFVTDAPRFGINMSSYWDEYVASWSDDWQPILGMNAHGQELLDLLANASAQEDSCQTPTSPVTLLQTPTSPVTVLQTSASHVTPLQTLPSHVALMQPPFVFINLIGLIIAGMFFVYA